MILLSDRKPALVFLKFVSSRKRRVAVNADSSVELGICRTERCTYILVALLLISYSRGSILWGGTSVATGDMLIDTRYHGAGAYAWSQQPEVQGTGLDCHAFVDAIVWCVVLLWSGTYSSYTRTRTYLAVLL